MCVCWICVLLITSQMTRPFWRQLKLSRLFPFTCTPAAHHHSAISFILHNIFRIYARNWYKSWTIAWRGQFITITLIKSIDTNGSIACRRVLGARFKSKPSMVLFHQWAFVAYVTTDRSPDKNGKHVRAPSHSAELFFCHVYLSHQGFRATLARCCGRVNSLTDIFVFTKQ